MDIQYLLWLQSFRDEAFTPFLEWVSLFGVRTLLIFPVFVYWCLNKRKGLFIFYSWLISLTINSLVKLTVCVYRPWVRDARIIPAGDSIKTANGYSFPSGHVMMATPLYGGLATCTKNKLIQGLLVIAILFTAFSRNYLGVHTPQDVVVGMLLGVLSLYISHWILNYIDRHPEKDGLVILITALVGIATMIYITFKPYPMDYVDGKLLVDPVKMQIDAWGDAGGIAPFALAWYIESRFIKFEPTGWNVKGVIICLIGLVPLYWIIWNLRPITTGILGPHAGKFASRAITIFYFMIVWPLVIKFFTGKKA